MWQTVMDDYRKKMAEEELILELSDLRQQIKNVEKRKTGRMPVVCSDESIRAMAKLQPKKPADFYSIPGIGPAFVENYANDFLEVLEEYAPKRVELDATVTGNVEDVLRDLSKKLTNINRNNRMLYLPRLSAKYAIDLFDNTGSYNPLSILFEATKPIKIADVGEKAKARTLSAERYRNLTTLIRETVRDMRDKGQNDLYIAYPFAEGNLVNGEFAIRAPLCLFPVMLDRSTSDITVVSDPTRDVVYNGTLILANQKFNNLTTPMPDCVPDDNDPDNFLSNLLDFYAENGIKIEYDSNELKKFKEYQGDTFSRQTRGPMKLVHHIVIGKFPAYSNAIQRDFDGILSKGLVNHLVADLISEYGATDFYSENQRSDLSLNSDDKKLDISEHSLVYINALNNAQEAVLHATETMDELVVEGPPGTGKSQTITSLITQFVNQGKNVLMVSEKKTALDVVYSRLGNLSRYAMMIDDSTNKNQFYAQLEQLLNGDPTVPQEAPDLSVLSSEIDADVATLEVIAEKLFTPCNFGVAPYLLYMENRHINLNNHEQIKTYKTIRTMITEELMALPYDELTKIYRKFANGQLTEAMDQYQLTVERYPWFLKMKDTLSNFDLTVFADSINELIMKMDRWKSQSFFSRLFSKKSLQRDILFATREYFKRTPSSYIVRLMMEQPEAVKQSLEEFIPSYANLKPIVTSLTENEMLYLTALRKIHKICGGKVIEWNDEFYNTMLFEHIQRFEMENRTLIPKVASFDKIISSIEKAINEKQGLSKLLLAKVLSDHAKFITLSKRKGEINRTIESKRRPSVAKFIKKFDFELFKSIKIWLMTPEAVSEILPQQNDLFDLLIFDEASQLYVEKSIPSIIRAKKVVIAGDHKQLRPSSLGEGRFTLDDATLDEDAEISAALEEESLLDLARFRYPDVLLNTHYRSKYEELIDFSNYAFYRGRLFVAPNTDTPSKPPIEVHMVKNAVWEGRSNRKEAEEVVALIKKFFAARKKNETLGVISFNSSQRDLIMDVIDEESAKDHKFGLEVRAEMERKDNGEDTGLFVKNIESVQGDERDVIIFSIGYAKNSAGKLVHNFGWLNQKGGENRLNVAISRAKQKIHIVTSFLPSELVLDTSKNEGPKILKRYLEYAHAISNGDKEEAERILQSFGDAASVSPAAIETEYAQSVARALREKGYEVDEQVGIGGYRIDMAIRKKGKYVLGIECDGKLYNTPASARERDYHRQKYLESRGWKILRIWSMDWWRDSKREIRKICDLIESL